MNRRAFLKSSGLALVAGAVLPNVFVRMAQAGTARGKRVLVAIFQRGAVDGLNVVVPYGEQAYYAARPTLAIKRDQLLDLDGFFGLHPSLAPLLPHFKNKDLGFVQAVGSPDATRSHFDAQDFMESGTPGIKSTQDGFLARALGKEAAKPLAAVALSQSMPRILSGASGAVALADVSRFGVRGPAGSVFESLYGDAFEAANILKKADPAKLQPANGAQYPRGPLGDSLRQIAQLIRSDVGLEIAFTDVGGWDTHAGEANALANNLKSFGEAIAAFAQDLGSRMNDVVLVTMSEFGRTVRENGNRGTDHGHANVMMLMGAGVQGGRVHGRWPGLKDLYEGRDLAVTTDFRDVFGEVLTKHLAVPSLAPVFPGYSVTPPRVLA